MRFATLVLLMAFSDPISATDQRPLSKKPSGFDKVMRSMFQPRTDKKEVKQKKTKKRRSITPTLEKPKEASTKMFVVDQSWMARYWELEAAWDYEIPEDDQIKWINGKYLVPLVVFKHYEDMQNTPRRRAASSGESSQPISPVE